MNEKFENILLLKSILFHHLFCFCFNFKKVACFFKFEIIYIYKLRSNTIEDLFTQLKAI